MVFRIKVSIKWGMFEYITYGQNLRQFLGYRRVEFVGQGLQNQVYEDGIGFGVLEGFCVMKSLSYLVLEWFVV